MQDEEDVNEVTDDDGPKDKGNGKDEEIHIEVLAPDSPGGEDSLELVTEPEREPEPQPKPNPLEKTIAQLKAQRDDYYERMLRKHADFENYKKRAEKDKREFQQYALSDFMLELVSILDNFDRALSHGEDQASPDYRKGIELIHRQLRDLMEKKGLRAMETEGKPFDPTIHEAILREQHDELPENTILQELQKGYYFREKLLRPAMVKVSFRLHKDESEPEQENGADKPTEE